jgi:hypothetical protein
MKRLFLIWILFSLIASVVLITLVLIEPISIFTDLKYIILAVSSFVSAIALQNYTQSPIHQQLIHVLILTLLFLPIIIPLISIFNTRFITEYWEVLIAGTLFQMGTALFSNFNGFSKDHPKLIGFFAQINYFLFILLAVLAVLNGVLAIQEFYFICIGVIVSLLSCILVFLKSTSKVDSKAN